MIMVINLTTVPFNAKDVKAFKNAQGICKADTTTTGCLYQFKKTVGGYEMSCLLKGKLTESIYNELLKDKRKLQQGLEDENIIRYRIR